MSNKGCGLLETPYNFFIDHLAPLCALLEIPLISSNPQTKFLYQNYYPEVDFRLKKWSMAYLVEQFDNVLYSFVPEPSFKTILKEEQKKNPQDPLWKKKTRFIYHFHGCSDKGYHSKWIDSDGHINDVDLLLLYGQRMKDLLKDKNLIDKPRSILEVGNYRLAYYLKHKRFFDQKVHADIFSKFKRDLPVLFYAPTWQDHENSCSFFQLSTRLIQDLSKEFNILMKLHPNMTLKTSQYDPTNALKVIQDYACLENVLVLPFYPLIYPLIEYSSFYLGDFSSVGYDVLAFNKPMFFLNVNDRPLNDKGSHLFQCGTVLNTSNINSLKDLLSSSLKKPQNPFIEIQNKTYHYAFGNTLSYSELKKKINKFIY